ncbi:NUDIX domain-containing protein [Nonomuraea sp. NPDC049486]|uniref:NUDIX domain-containing protein n=1 Tax=Nonomuraea harbinensis TaxID=1286938 RepID=A0ABW1BKU5_9ACTN|nr:MULTISPECIES: NUDIX domain-containing protein [Nonomuraea]TXK34294.1 NUDIX domain-containing protein [Nonomuraea sp. C10]
MVDRLLGGLTEADLANEEKVRIVVAQKAFMADRNRLLLVRKSPSDPYNPGLWEVPGGRMRGADEGLDEHIVREVREEAGIEIEPGPPFHMWDWAMPADDGGCVRVIAVARQCRALSHEVTTSGQISGDHIDEVRWVRLDAVARYPLIPGIDGAVERFLRLRGAHPSEAVCRR